MPRLLFLALSLSLSHLFFTITISASGPKKEVPSVKAIQKHLSQRYPVKSPRVAGELQFELETSLIEFAAPAIRRADSTLRLYRTSFSTGHFEYPEVEVAVAAWMEGGVLKTAECLSPVYTGESTSFIGRFRGLKGKSAAEREKLANEICEVFSGITYRGRTVGGRLDNDEYRADLWHDKMKWRTMQVTFDGNGAIRLVKLVR